MKIFFICYGVWNLFTFLLYGIDKLKAKRGSQRISEANLLWCAFVMGAVGALLGRAVFRHKTQKTKFTVLLPIAFVLNVLIVVAAVAWCMGWI